MTWYFDSHIHLSDSQYLSDIEFILKGMEFMKMKACCVSVNAENSLETLNLAKKTNMFYLSLEFILNMHMKVSKK